MRLPITIIFALLGFSAGALGAESEKDPCGRAPAGMVVDVDRTTLFLCKKGQTDARYRVNLGQGGSGKTKQGDKKTPLGRYPLSPPRDSRSGFTYFIPIGYPTAKQRTAGYTGGAIGIHGPPDWLAQIVIDSAFETPWTDGCIMVRTTDEIREIRAWAIANAPKAIVLYASGVREIGSSRTSPN